MRVFTLVVILGLTVVVTYAYLSLPLLAATAVSGVAALLLYFEWRDCVMAENLPSFTCPVCGATSYHPKDIEHGYCGRCHDFTGPA